MRVLIVTSGSMGDVAPYTGLAARLCGDGHEVTLATHAPFADAVRAAGTAFHPLPGDLRAVLPQAHGQDGERSGTGPRALAQLLRIAHPLIAELGDGIAAAAEATRPQAMLLSTMVAPLGYQVAEAAGVPWAGAFLQPIAPTGAFGSVLLGGRSVGAPGNRALTAAALTVSQGLYRGPVMDLRRSLGLPRQGLRRLRARQDGGRFPTFHGFSTAVVPRPRDWRPQLEVVGYWWPAPRPGWTPPPELAAFLTAGPPPVFVGFGSMATGQGERLAGTVRAAVERAGVRAVVQAGWSGLDVGGDDRVLSIGEVPHDWLFPRVAAVVHHAGAGTTAAGLRAGVPAVAVPVLADQPFWAARLHALGAAPPPLPLRRLTADTLAAAITEARRDDYARCARGVSRRLATEDGTARVADWIRNRE
ncbi:glycosyltransferase [Spirilliplanes yamanashiensis]|uniref:Glycosyl transferase n=1 Tax=Spirilliplanes yamanashiensis TaxID=42233 RepID=A0A8J3Y9N0_9ACTN|nr:glycosyltransferase [Spirilliplanes yamanashiensis]MDP9817751.1 UDP:flavonoid glycosyltransferase YjiC (YdhE family) [Spirilliplanes yamanashiensis]GIJ04561.1 glycosyl transferase [Spirilliplanes yamanashiensis]